MGYFNFFTLYGFLSFYGYDATDNELRAVIRRIEGGGNQRVDFDEFEAMLQPIIIKMHDIQYVEDQGVHIAKKAENARPFL